MTNLLFSLIKFRFHPNQIHLNHRHLPTLSSMRMSRCLDHYNFDFVGFWLFLLSFDLCSLSDLPPLLIILCLFGLHCCRNSIESILFLDFHFSSFHSFYFLFSGVFGNTLRPVEWALCSGAIQVGLLYPKSSILCTRFPVIFWKIIYAFPRFE